MRTKNKFGFTLSELMAVVIIVAILTVLATGYYRRAVEQSRFSEGLAAASAVSEAINRACLERQMNGLSCSSSAWTVPEANQLDVNLPDGSNCAGDKDEDPSRMFCTKYFRISYDKHGAVEAIRRDGMYSDSNDSHYAIHIQPHFASVSQDQISCNSIGQTSKEFCQAMGYTKCIHSDAICTKPN